MTFSDESRKYFFARKRLAKYLSASRGARCVVSDDVLMIRNVLCSETVAAMSLGSFGEIINNHF